MKDRRFGKEAKESIDIDDLIRKAYDVRKSNPELFIDKRGNGVKWYGNDDGQSLYIYGIDIETFPDLSMYKNLRTIQVSECNLTSMPPASSLPKNIVILTLKDNDITEIKTEGYDRLPELFVINVGSNPVERIDADSVNTIPKLIRLIYYGEPAGYDELKDELKPYEP